MLNDKQPTVVCYRCGFVTLEGVEPPTTTLCGGCLVKERAEWDEPTQEEREQVRAQNAKIRRLYGRDAC